MTYIMTDNSDGETVDEGRNAKDDQESRARSKRIGAKLQQLYDDVVNEEIPEDFLKILREADDKRGSS